MKYSKIKLLTLAVLTSLSSFAGNDDKRGQAGATELLMNPWVKSAGWTGGSLAGITGTEAMRFNVAGIAETENMEVTFANTQWYLGSGISSYAFGYTQKAGDSAAFGISLMSMNFGDFIETTSDLPEGTGVTFKPQFFNLGLSYAKQFSDNVNGGVLVRIVSESVSNVSASGIAIDAGVQYRGGEKDRFKFGVSLRNVGSKLQFSGDGLSYRGAVQSGFQYNQTLQQRSEKFEMPSTLNISASYDVKSTLASVMTLGGTFNSNSYTYDRLQFGGQYAYRKKFFLRAGYEYYTGVLSGGIENTSLNSGITAGVGVEVPLSSSLDEDKKLTNSAIGFDYSFRTSQFFGGTHGLSVTMKL